MIKELELLKTYFDLPNAVLYEEDLVKKFGRGAVTSAIQSGALQHRWVPCGRGKRRCVCWTS